MLQSRDDRAAVRPVFGAGYTGNIRMGTAVLRIAARKFVKLTKNF